MMTVRTPSYVPDAKFVKPSMWGEIRLMIQALNFEVQGIARCREHALGLIPSDHPMSRGRSSGPKLSLFRR